MHRRRCPKNRTRKRWIECPAEIRDARVDASRLGALLRGARRSTAGPPGGACGPQLERDSDRVAVNGLGFPAFLAVVDRRISRRGAQGQQQVLLGMRFVTGEERGMLRSRVREDPNDEVATGRLEPEVFGGSRPSSPGGRADAGNGSLARLLVSFVERMAKGLPSFMISTASGANRAFTWTTSGPAGVHSPDSSRYPVARK